MNPRLITAIAPAAALASPAVLVAGIGVVAGLLILDFLDDSPKPARAGETASSPQLTPDVPKAQAPRPVALQVAAPAPRRLPAQLPAATPAPYLPTPAPRLAPPVAA